MKRIVILILVFLMIIPSNIAMATFAVDKEEPTPDYSRYFGYSIREDGTAVITNYVGPVQKITIPEQLDGHPVTAISGNIWFGFVKQITIPNSLEEILSNPFKYSGVEKIIVSPDHPTLEVIDGILYGKQDHRLIICPINAGAGECAIQPGTVEICAYAFAYCKNLKGVSIPDSVVKIGDGAFTDCYSLEHISIPDSVKEIGINPFTGCSALRAIDVDTENSTYTVLDGALYDLENQKLIRVPCSLNAENYLIQEGIHSIGPYAFSQCDQLKAITIPDSVTEIGQGAFYQCGSLESVVLPQGLQVIEDCLFEECKQLREIVIPSGVTAINDSAFAECTSLTHVIIPDTVTRIGTYAFGFCKSLIEADLPDGVSILEYGVFNCCEGLERVGLPAGLKEIGKQTFTYCVKLQSVTIPEGVTSIGYMAFCWCESLKEVTLPSSLSVIDNSAFACCDSLTEIVIPEGVTSIRDIAFVNCPVLTSVTLPASLTEIGEDVFSVYDNELSEHVPNPGLTLTVVYGSYANQFFWNTIPTVEVSRDGYFITDEWMDPQFPFDIEQYITEDSIIPFSDEHQAVQMAQSIINRLHECGKFNKENLFLVDHAPGNDLWLFSYSEWPMEPGFCLTVVVNGKEGKIMSAWLGE